MYETRHDAQAILLIATRPVKVYETLVIKCLRLLLNSHKGLVTIENGYALPPPCQGSTARGQEIYGVELI